jgi:hypothetical protein
MDNGKVCFWSDAVHILIRMLAIIRGRMIDAGLIEAVVSPLSDQDKKVHIDGIKFAAQMAFDGKVTVDIVNYSFSLDTDEIRNQVDWPQCVKFVQEGIKDDDRGIRDSSCWCTRYFLRSSMWPSYQSESLMK